MDWMREQWHFIRPGIQLNAGDFFLFILYISFHFENIKRKFFGVTNQFYSLSHDFSITRRMSTTPHNFHSFDKWKCWKIYIRVHLSTATQKKLMAKIWKWGEAFLLFKFLDHLRSEDQCSEIHENSEKNYFPGDMSNVKWHIINAAKSMRSIWQASGANKWITNDKPWQSQQN